MRNAVVTLIVTALSVPVARAQAPTAQEVSKMELSGPYAHGNLTVFLLHGAAPGPGRARAAGMLSLEEALDRKQVVITERGSVNRLWARNTGKAPVYLQGGDIVKGGRQDRVLEQDAILEPGAKEIALPVFCVEQGRWQARGAEPAAHFSSSKHGLVTRKQKLAAKAAASQAAVWQSVAEAQDAIAEKVAAPVKAAASETSLQLSLENDKLRASADPVVAALQGIVERRPDAVGYAFAVGGALSAVDVYASPVLFKKLWPKLLRASAVEALAEARPGTPPAALTADSVRQFLAAAEKGAITRQASSPRTSLERRETPEAVMFDTSDDGAPVHRNYLRK
jgi:hypothetical protein